MSVAGIGVVSVELNWGSDSDKEHGDGSTTADSFPFDFTIILDNNLNLIEVEQIPREQVSGPLF